MLSSPLRALVLLVAALPAACGGASPPPPVTELGDTQGMDPFVVEFVEPHVRAAKADPGNAGLRGTLGLVYEANKLWGLARSAFLNAHALDPDEPSWSFHAAILAMTQGDSEEAQQRLIELRERYPVFAPGRYRLGTMFFEQGRLDEALGEFVEVCRLEPRWAEARVARAEVLVELGRAAEALELLDEAKGLDAGYDRIHYVRGQALRELGRGAEAERELFLGLDAQRISLMDAYAQRKDQYIAGYEARNGKAVDLMHRGRHAEAIPVLEQILERLPGDASTSNNLSVAYRKVGRTTDAMNLLAQAHEKNPTHFPTLINLSGSYWEMGRFDDALDAATKAVALVPQNGRARYSLARAQLSLGRIAEACAELEESVRLDSSEPGVIALYAETLMRLARFEEAEGAWITVLEKMPDHFIARYNLAKCQLRVGKIAEAGENYDRLVASEPGRPELQALAQELGR